MMDDKQLDKLFREKLESHSAPVEGGDELWSAISSSLDKNAADNGVIPVVWRKRLFYAVPCAAAVMIAVYFLFAPSSPKPHIDDSNEKSVLAQQVENVREILNQPKDQPKEQPKIQPKDQPIEKKQDNVAALTQTHTLTLQTSTNQAQDSVSISLYVAEVGVIPNREEKKKESPGRMSQKEDLLYEARYLAQEDGFDKKIRSKYTMALASNILSGNSIDTSPNGLRQAMLSGGGAKNPAGVPNIEQVSQTKYSLPLNVGIQIQIQLNSFLSVGAGVNYTMLRSKYDGLIDKKMHSVKQTLHYIGIPVNFYGTFLQKNGFSLYANLGGAVEKGVRAVYTMRSYDQLKEYSTSVEGMQYSVNFGIGAEYRFIKQIGIYLEPNAVYFFNSEITNSIRTDQPFQLKAELGFRFHL